MKETKIYWSLTVSLIRSSSLFLSEPPAKQPRLEGRSNSRPHLVEGLLQTRQTAKQPRVEKRDLACPRLVEGLLQTKPPAKQLRAEERSNPCPRLVEGLLQAEKQPRVGKRDLSCPRLVEGLLQAKPLAKRRTKRRQVHAVEYGNHVPHVPEDLLQTYTAIKERQQMSDSIVPLQLNKLLQGCTAASIFGPHFSEYLPQDHTDTTNCDPRDADGLPLGRTTVSNYDPHDVKGQPQDHTGATNCDPHDAKGQPQGHTGATNCDPHDTEGLPHAVKNCDPHDAEDLPQGHAGATNLAPHDEESEGLPQASPDEEPEGLPQASPDEEPEGLPQASPDEEPEGLPQASPDEEPEGLPQDNTARNPHIRVHLLRGNSDAAKCAPHVSESPLQGNTVAMQQRRWLADDSVRLTERAFPEPIPDGKRLSCRVCCRRARASGERRVQSRFQCRGCKVPLCVWPCFEIYHTQLHY